MSPLLRSIAEIWPYGGLITGSPCTFAPPRPAAAGAGGASANCAADAGDGTNAGVVGPRPPRPAPGAVPDMKFISVRLGSPGTRPICVTCACDDTYKM